MRAFLRKLLPVGLLFGTFALSSCGSRPGTEDWFKREVYDLQFRTVPPNCNGVISTTAPAKDRMSLVARWECDSPWDSGHYRQWVATRFETGYKTVHSDSERLVFGKNLGGDFESVDIESKRAGDTLHIRVLVQAYPD